MKHILKNTYSLLFRYVFILLPDTLFFNLIGWIDHVRFGKSYKWMHIKHPKTFNEKINYLKIHPAIQNGAILADKYKVREFVAKTIGPQYLIPLIGVWKDPKEIDFNALPPQFVLKANQGSGMNIICRDKSKLDIEKTIKHLNQWLKTDPFYHYREWQYKNIEHVILAEKLLEYNIFDYKFFCFDGEPKFVQIDLDRFSGHKRIIYDMAWQRAPFNLIYPAPDFDMPRPVQFDEMIELCRKLSKGCNFIRVDLYIYDNKIYFGELTLHPEGGTAVIIPKKYDLILGNLLKLDVPKQK